MLFLPLYELIVERDNAYALDVASISSQVDAFISQASPDSQIKTTIPRYKDGTITFAYKKIPLGKAKQQKLICSVIFKNDTTMRKNWEIDDLLVENGEHDLDDGRRMSYYQSAREINQKVENKTGISDFFKTDTYHIQINPKYFE